MVRVVKYIQILQRPSLMLKKPFDKATKENIIKLVEKIERNKKWSEWIKHDYKIIPKKFYY